MPRPAALRSGFRAAVLAILLVVIPGSAMAKLDSVLAVLRHIGEAATVGLPSDASPTALTVATISRLVVITVRWPCTSGSSNWWALQSALASR